MCAFTFLLFSFSFSGYDIPISTAELSSYSNIIYEPVQRNKKSVKETFLQLSRLLFFFVAANNGSTVWKCQKWELSLRVPHDIMPCLGYHIFILWLCHLHVALWAGFERETNVVCCWMLCSINEWSSGDAVESLSNGKIIDRKLTATAAITRMAIATKPHKSELSTFFLLPCNSIRWMCLHWKSFTLCPRRHVASYMFITTKSISLQLQFFSFSSNHKSSTLR